MDISYINQVPINDDETIKYEFEDDIIHVTMVFEEDKYTDSFDFTDLPNGQLELEDDKGNDLIETALPINPLLSAKKEEGVLSVELLNWIGSNATEEERFPEWIDTEV